VVKIHGSISENKINSEIVNVKSLPHSSKK